jgi:hypothetical protein
MASSSISKLENTVVQSIEFEEYILGKESGNGMEGKNLEVEKGREKVAFEGRQSAADDNVHHNMLLE